MLKRIAELLHRKTADGVSPIGAALPNDSRPLEQAPGVRSCSDQDGLVLFHLGKGLVFKANHIGAKIWRGVIEEKRAEDTLFRLSKEYSLLLEQVRQDARAFLLELRNYGLIVGNIDSV